MTHDVATNTFPQVDCTGSKKGIFYCLSFPFFKIYSVIIQIKNIELQQPLSLLNNIDHTWQVNIVD